MKKVLILIYMLLIATPSMAKNNTSMEVFQSQINELRSAIQEVKTFDESRFNTAVSLANQSGSNIGNMLTAASMGLALVGLALTIGGIFLGWYVSSKTEEVHRSMKKIEVLKKDLEDFINANNDNIYKRVIENDTKSLLISLKNNPLNITNIASILAVRSIIGLENWDLIKQAYINCCERYSNQPETQLYISLIMQFYPEMLIDRSESKILDLIYKNRRYCQKFGFFEGEIINLVGLFSKERNKKILEILLQGIMLSHLAYDCFNNNQEFKNQVILRFKESYDKNKELRDAFSEFVSQPLGERAAIIPEILKAIK